MNVKIFYSVSAFWKYLRMELISPTVVIVDDELLEKCRSLAGVTSQDKWVKPGKCKLRFKRFYIGESWWAVRMHNFNPVSRYEIDQTPGATRPREIIGWHTANQYLGILEDVVTKELTTCYISRVLPIQA